MKCDPSASCLTAVASDGGWSKIGGRRRPSRTARPTRDARSFDPAVASGAPWCGDDERHDRVERRVPTGLVLVDVREEPVDDDTALRVRDEVDGLPGMRAGHARQLLPRSVAFSRRSPCVSSLL